MQVRDQLEVLQAASGELMACSDFMILLRAVLTLGNHLNEGTMRGAASGRPSCPASADPIPGHMRSSCLASADTIPGHMRPSCLASADTIPGHMRPSCLASADTIPGHMLTMQCLATKPCKGTSVYRVLPCRVMLGSHSKEGLV